VRAALVCTEYRAVKTGRMFAERVPRPTGGGRGTADPLRPRKQKQNRPSGFGCRGWQLVEPGPWPDRRAGDGVAVAADGSVRGRQ
jgi:hypothetical protein